MEHWEGPLLIIGVASYIVGLLTLYEMSERELYTFRLPVIQGLNILRVKYKDSLAVVTLSKSCNYIRYYPAWDSFVE